MSNSMWIVVSVIVISFYFWRKYKPQKYSTQKYSRWCDYIEKTQLTPLKVPWNVHYEDYTPLGEIDENYIWWFNLTFIDGRARFLIEVSPYTFRGVPVNPLGRTGVIGRGLFSHSGPYSVLITISWSKISGFLSMSFTKGDNFLYRGYLDHPMNTDNAWMEATIYYTVKDTQLQDTPVFIDRCPEWLKMFVKEVSNKESSKFVNDLSMKCD